MFNKEKRRATESTMQKLLCMTKEENFNKAITKYVFPHILLLKEYKTAIKNNDLLAVKRLCAIEQEAKVIGHNYSMSPVHYAAKHCRAEIVDILISNGYHVNSKLLKGSTKTPLHFASTVDVVNCLTKHGANTEAKSLCGYTGNATPLYFAVISGNYEVLEALYNRGAKVLFEDENSALTAAVCSVPNPSMGAIIKFLCSVDCNPLVRNYLEWHIPITILITERKCCSLDAVYTLFQHTLKHLLEGVACAPNKNILEKLSSSKQYLSLPDLDRKVLKEFYIEHVYRNFLSFCLVDKHLCNALLGSEFKSTFTADNVFHLLPLDTTRLIGAELTL